MVMSLESTCEEVGMMDIKLGSAISAASTSIKVNESGRKEQVSFPSTPLESLDSPHSVSSFL